MEAPSRFQKPKEEVVAFGIKVEPVPRITLDSMEDQLEAPHPFLHQFILKGLPSKWVSPWDNLEARGQREVEKGSGYLDNKATENTG